jgi:amphi-Trp domain-containing protein
MEAEREIEKNYSVTEFVAELRRLADMLEANEDYTIDLDGEAVAVPQDAVASVVYEIEDGHAEIEFQLSWNAGEAEDDDQEEDEDQDEAAA